MRRHDVLPGILGGVHPLRWCRSCYPIGLLVALACGDGPSGILDTGSLVLRTLTTGTDLDPDGYTVRLDSQPPLAIGISDSLLVEEMQQGGHTVELEGLASNCSSEEANPLTISIQPPASTEVVLHVACTLRTGVLQIRAFTSGSAEPDDPFVVRVDGVQSRPISPDGAVALVVAPGEHQVLLDGLPPECAVQGPNPQVTSVAADDVARVTFSVSCTATGA
jgi:hypothetical protein